MRIEYVIALLMAMSMATSAVTVCNSVNLDYELQSYSSIDSCYVGSGFTQSFDIGAQHQVLKLDSVTQKYGYVPVTALAVGDTVQSVVGTTTITGISVTSIESPYIALGQIFNEDTYANNQFSPYSVTSLLRWISLDAAAGVTLFKPIVTDSYSVDVYTLDYWVPSIENTGIATALDVFLSANVQYDGSLSCNGTMKEFYYYDPGLLLRPLALDVLYRSFRVMSINAYFDMLSYALGQPDGVFYDGSNVIYDYVLNVPSCDALTITTADGYLIVNGLVLS